MTAVTNTPAPAPSPAEAAVIARFGIFEAEERVEKVARAMWATRGLQWSQAEFRAEADDFRVMAAAAIAALADSPAEQAVRRAEALAEEFDEATLPALISEFDRGLVVGYARAAARIRAALAPQTGGQS